MLAPDSTLFLLENGPLAFLPKKFHGQRSMVGYSPWSCKESDMTEQLTTHFTTSIPFPFIWTGERKNTEPTVLSGNFWMLISCIFKNVKV